MKPVLAAALLALLVGGCLPAVPPSPPDSSPEAVSVAPEPAAPVALAPAPTPDPAAMAAAVAAATAEVDALLAGPAEGEELDAETRDDNAALAAADQAAPDDEGATVPAAEVTFDFPVVENAKVRYFIDYFSGPGHKAFARWLARSGRYLPLMRQIFADQGLPQDLAYLAMIESGFNERAYSWANAVGPWQFIASTGRMMGLEADWWRDERRDFEKSTEAAARFLKDLHERFDGDWYLAVASYNAGPGKVAQAIRKYHTRDFWELSRGKYLQAETKNYLPKLLAAMLIAKSPEKYGFTEVDYHPPLAFDTVTVPTATDLEVVADLCDADYEAIKRLNPELKRWCTPPGEKDYQLRIPAGSRSKFLAGYAELPPGDRANYKHHRVRKGDTLLAIAKRNGIRVADILALNTIRNPRVISIGTDLVLPLKKGLSRLPVEELKDDYVRTRRRTYTVRSGDSLWKISRRFDVSERNLRVWNRLGWSNVIRPGQKLVVSATAARRTAAARHQAAGPVHKIVYKVRPGDTLWGIGRQFDVATSQIMNWNNLADDHILRPGDTLTLLVQSDDRRG